MTMYGHTGIFSLQLVDELTQSLALCRCARVLRFAYCVDSANIAHADRCGVMPGGVCAYAADVASLVNAAVEIDDVVVADASKTALAMPLVNVGDGVVTPLGRRCAVHNDLLDVSHNLNY